ncbi:OmpA family protein [Rhodobacter sphaeroides]|uniref:OmpA family protein n=1 Tax=Cereibacter sphaeroides TaxID=1063 RepID=UPI00132360AE|nr:OmpA family protein [Cereibacter sphaeroides]MWP37926.1 OmpA family protein [Cereibacter sphaeroides]
MARRATLTRRICALLLAGLAAAPTGAGAEGLTDAELLGLFHRQRDAFAAARSGNGQARGLKLVTVDRIGPAPAVADVPDSLGAPAGEDPGLRPTASTDSAPGETGRPVLGLPQGADRLAAADPPPEGREAAEVSPESFGLLDPALQVNVRIHFAFDSAVLASDQTPLLAQLCTVMKASDIRLFQIVGHTDAAGSAAYNQQLSLMRAEEVRRYLTGPCGIAPERLRAVGMGERFLTNQSDPRSGENRRVEFQALS